MNKPNQQRDQKLLPTNFPKIDRGEYKQHKDRLRILLSKLQRKAIDKGLPIIIVFEGWDAAGKGALINKLIQALDPRGFQVFSDPLPQHGAARPFLAQYWNQTPAQGRFAIFDRSWYRYLLDATVAGKASAQTRTDNTNDVLAFEQQLADAGVLIHKIFLHISKKEQARRLAKLQARAATSWRVTAADEKRHTHYHRYAEATERMLSQTDTPFAPWTIIPAKNRRYATIQVMESVANAIDSHLAENADKNATTATGNVSASRPQHESPVSLRTTDLSVFLSRDEYNQQIKKRQKRLSDLQNMLYTAQIPMAILYEGWDAAGKGGNIRRLTQRLDPRGYEVVPIAAPTPIEKKHHYLWRFWNKMPQPGHITVFDRTWYGRVLVERVEGFCSDTEWHRAYNEINAIEAHLAHAGMIIVKFWLHIDPDEQLRRFEERQATSFKQWKITDEDWRNREKWPQYEDAVEDMLQYTHTRQAPWTVLAANCKLHARLQAIDTVIAAIEAKTEQ